jgi:hypothetical protein
MEDSNNEEDESNNDENDENDEDDEDEKLEEISEKMEALTHNNQFGYIDDSGNVSLLSLMHLHDSDYSLEFHQFR